MKIEKIFVSLIVLIYFIIIVMSFFGILSSKATPYMIIGVPVVGGFGGMLHSMP